MTDATAQTGGGGGGRAPGDGRAQAVEGWVLPPSRPAVQRQDFMALFLFLTLFIPSFVVSIPGLPDVARTSDFIGLFCVIAYAWSGGRVQRGEALLLLHLGGMFVISYGALLALSGIPEFAGAIETTNMLYPIRNLFLYAPALLAFHLAVPRDMLARLGFRFTLLAVLFVLVMCGFYIAGSELFNAHQTLETAAKEGVWSRRIHRLGGIVGETGAFGFHAVLVFELMVFFAFLGGRMRLAYALLFLSLPYVVFVYAQCQTRVSLANGLLFFAILVYSRDVMGRFQATFLTLFGAIAIGVFLWQEFAQNAQLVSAYVTADNLLLSRFAGLFSGEGEGLDTSGRLEHWTEIVKWIGVNPIFGYGSRTLAIVLGYAMENFFLQGLADWGAVVFGLFIAFLVWLRRSLHMGDIPADGRFVAERRAGAALKAILVASFLQWQVNDINTFFQAFPMLGVVTILYVNRLKRIRLALHGKSEPWAG